jgi:hypothetical protein
MYLSAAGPILVLLLVLYLGNEFRVLEDELRYMPPANRHSLAAGAGKIDIIDGQTVYVPAYSHIYSRGGEPHLLEVTLSIRNTDPKRGIRLREVRYYDTQGTLVKNYLDGILELGPLETVEFLVEKQDTQGGSGANFIIIWDASKPVYEPIIEAVMVGLTKEHSISFISPSRTLAERTE